MPILDSIKKVGIFFTPTVEEKFCDCGTLLTEENTYHRISDKDICYECQANIELMEDNYENMVHLGPPLRT